MTRSINQKKAQSGSQAAILVIIITVLLVLFILSISPEDRDALLNGDSPSPGTDPAFPDSVTLFRANPGKIPYMPQNERLHEFAPFNLNAETKGELIYSKNSLYLKRSAFERITDTFTFAATPDLSSNILLTFNVENAAGSLIIRLNGETIFNAPIAPGSAPPINIAASSLRQQNTLSFEVSGPGAAFWRYNYYTINNINIYGDILDLSRSRATQVFNVGVQEINEMESSTLRYLPSCSYNGVKDMVVMINNLQVFRGVPDCEIFNTIQVPTNYLQEGINEITFQIREGRVLIDRTRILNELDEPDTTTYYFEVRDRYFSFINDSYVLRPEFEAMLDITFPNTNQKRFEIIMNGKPMLFNTARQRETRNLYPFLQPGTNSIEIHPNSDMAITEIRVRIRQR